METAFVFGNTNLSLALPLPLPIALSLLEVLEGGYSHIRHPRGCRAKRSKRRATMKFGEFLTANIIDGLEDAYLDYQHLVAIVEGEVVENGVRLSFECDSLKIGSMGMPINTRPSLGKQVRGFFSALWAWVVLTYLYLEDWACCCFRRKDRSDVAGLSEPLVTSCDILDKATSDALKSERHEEFLAAMHSELARCNQFLMQKEGDLEASINSLIQTVDSFTGTKATPPSFRRPSLGAVVVETPPGLRSRGNSAADQPLPEDHEAPSPTPPAVVSPNTSPRVSFTQLGMETPPNGMRRQSGHSEGGSSGYGTPYKTPSRRNSDHSQRLDSYKTPPPLFQAIWSQPDTIEHAYREMHVLIMQLKQVATVNLTGFQKAAKKCKKHTKTAVKSDFGSQFCCKSENLDDLAEKLTKSYARNFTNHDLDKARSKLMIYKASLKPSLKVGFFLGVDVALTFVLIWINMYQPAKQDCPFCPASLVEVIPVYRVIFFPILFIWGWSALVYLWRSFGINYLWILDMDPKSELGIHGSASLAATMTSFCLLSLILYTGAVKTGQSNSPLSPLSNFFLSLLPCEWID